MLYHDKNTTIIGKSPANCDVYCITIFSAGQPVLFDAEEFLIYFDYCNETFISIEYTDGRYGSVDIEMYSNDIDVSTISKYMNALNISPSTIIDNYLRDDIQHILNELLGKLIAVHTLYMDSKNMVENGIKRIMFPSNVKRAE